MSAESVIDLVDASLFDFHAVDVSSFVKPPGKDVQWGRTACGQPVVEQRLASGARGREVVSYAEDGKPVRVVMTGGTCCPLCRRVVSGDPAPWELAAT